ncbi:MAG: hypothetical protein PHN78_02705 [Dehalococcoidales bacterium]|nr:hypothetical protein [Dehalococcoidales bacterium]
MTLVPEDVENRVKKEKYYKSQLDRHYGASKKRSHGARLDMETAVPFLRASHN